jgi:DNA-binding XRE family transcriptional regulator
MTELAAQLVTVRIERQMSQLAVAVAMPASLRTVDELEHDAEHFRLSLATRYAAALGHQLVLTFPGADGGQGSWALSRTGPAAPAPVRHAANLATMLDQLAGIAHTRPRRHAAVMINLDLAYRVQVAAVVWGRTPTPGDRWVDLPRWRGVPVNLVPFLDDRIVLVRGVTTPRWPDPIAAGWLAPDGLDPDAAECYAALRHDGVPAGEATALAVAVCQPGRSHQPERRPPAKV